MKTLFQSFNVLLAIGLSLSLLGGLFPKASAKVRQLSRPAKCSAVFFTVLLHFIACRGISGRFCGIVCCFPAFDMLYSILQGLWEGWFSGPAFPKKMKMQCVTLYLEV